MSMRFDVPENEERPGPYLTFEVPVIVSPTAQRRTIHLCADPNWMNLVADAIAPRGAPGVVRVTVTYLPD